MHVTTAQTDLELSRPVAPFAARVVLPIAGLVLVSHCAALFSARGYWFDEVYMLAIGRHHLDWGSADQPPLVPALAALMDTLAPGSLLMLRLPAVVATAGAVVLAALIARELGCDRRAQGLTAAAQATGLWATFSGHWLTPYTLEPVQWLLLIWVVVRWVRLRDDRLLLIAGLVVGIAAMTKFQVVLLCVVLLAGAAVVGPRELLRRRMLWAGASIAAVLAAPTVVWQQLHGWPQLQMTRVVAGEADVLYGGRSGIAVQMLVFAGVIGTALVLYGLWQLARAEELRPYRFLGVAFLVLFVLFVATAGRPYYLCGLYAPLAAAGALGLQRRRAAGTVKRRWLVWPVYALSAALAVGALMLSVAVTSSDVDEQIARQTAAAYHGLSDEQRDRTAVFGQSYIIAAYLAGYAPRYGLPEAHSASRSYGYFTPPPAELDSALYVGADDSELRPYFRDSRPVADIGDDMRIYLLTGRQQQWDAIWPQLRTLTVS